MTEAEMAELPESFRNACKNKTIQKTKRVVVDEATFNQDSLDSVESERWSEDFDLSFGLRVSSRQDNCSIQKVLIININVGFSIHNLLLLSNFQTSCSKFDKGCFFNWANPDGSTVKVHNLPKTVHCLSCCENQTTSTLCQCSNITSGSKWKNCCKYREKD